MTRATKKRLEDLAAAGLGGLVAALVSRVLLQQGMKWWEVALGLTVVGAVGTAVGEGRAQIAATGVAALGASQLALGWLSALEQRKLGLDRRDPERATDDARLLRQAWRTVLAEERAGDGAVELAA